MFLPLSSPFTASIFFLPPTPPLISFLPCTHSNPGPDEVTSPWARWLYCKLGTPFPLWVTLHLLSKLDFWVMLTRSCDPPLLPGTGSTIALITASTRQLWSYHSKAMLLISSSTTNWSNQLTHCLLYVMDKTTYFPCSLGGEWPTFWFNALGIIVPQETKQTCNWDGSCFPHSVHTPYLSGGED